MHIVGGPQDGDEIVIFRNQFKKILNERWFIMCLESSLKELRLGATGSAFLLDLFPWYCMSKLNDFLLHYNQVEEPCNLFPAHVHVNVDHEAEKALTKV